MPKLWTEKTTFGAGELAPSMQRRSDTQQYADGAKMMRDVRALNGGGVTRRPGTRYICDLPAGARLVEFTFSEDQTYLLAFSAGRMDAFTVEGVPAGSATGQPWTADDVHDMTWVQSGDVVFLAWERFHPIVVRRTGASSWSVGLWEADAGPGGALMQPYYKFAPPASTIQPTGRLGSVSVTASEDVFSPLHVGQRIRYVGREMLVTAFSHPSLVTALVVQELPSTLRLTVENIGGFRVQQVVEGRNTAAKGEVVAIDGGASTIDVVIIDGLIWFGVNEELDGPDSKTKITAVEEVAPGAFRDWDEQYLSPVYGYPAAVGLHRSRLWFGGHPALPSSVLASRVAQYWNFDLGTQEDAESIFEDVGDQAVARIRHFASAEQLLILTDQGPYYVPESAANPLRPTSIAFNRISAHGCGRARPQAFDEGTLYMHASGAAVMDVRPTGDQTKPWSGVDVALLAPHLLNDPVDAAATHGARGEPERYAYFVNADGSLAVLHSIQSQQVQGWSLWTTEGGKFRSIAVIGRVVYAAVERAIAGATRWTLERFDSALRVDCAVEVASTAVPVTLYAGDTVRVTAGDGDLGDATVSAGGVLDLAWPADGPLVVGRRFVPRVSPQTPEPRLQNGSTAGQVKRVCKVRAFLLDSTSRLTINGVALSAYRGGDDLSLPAPQRTAWVELPLLGRSPDPVVVIEQPDAAPFTVLAVSMEVIV